MEEKIAGRLESDEDQSVRKEQIDVPIAEMAIPNTYLMDIFFNKYREKDNNIQVSKNKFEFARKVKVNCKSCYEALQDLASLEDAKNSQSALPLATYFTNWILGIITNLRLPRKMHVNLNIITHDTLPLDSGKPQVLVSKGYDMINNPSLYFVNMGSEGGHSQIYFLGSDTELACMLYRAEELALPDYILKVYRESSDGSDNQPSNGSRFTLSIISNEN